MFFNVNKRRIDNMCHRIDKLDVTKTEVQRLFIDDLISRREGKEEKGWLFRNALHREILFLVEGYFSAVFLIFHDFSCQK